MSWICRWPVADHVWLIRSCGALPGLPGARKLLGCNSTAVGWQSGLCVKDDLDAALRNALNPQQDLGHKVNQLGDHTQAALLSERLCLPHEVQLFSTMLVMV